jgi:hypothetical protein
MHLLRPAVDSGRTPYRIMEGIKGKNYFYLHSSSPSFQVMSDVYQKNLIKLIRTYGMNFKDALVYDRIREELHIFCANHTVDEVYNTMFLLIVAHVKNRVQLSIERLGEGGIKLLNLVVPKPDIPTDIAANYKQVRAIQNISIPHR